jgi:hypothetical protein
MRASTSFFVVAAPGHYGDSTRVFSSHRTLQAAKKAAGPGYVVRKGHLTKGERFLRAFEDIYPVG